MADLKNILQTSNNAEGSIKCTYAEIYDEAGHKLFSLQRKSLAEKKNVPAGKKMLVQTGKDTFDVVSGVGAVDAITLDLDAPIVRMAAKPKETSRFVAVTLLPKAIQYIKEKILVPQSYYEVWAEYDVVKHGDWQRPRKVEELLWREHTLPPESTKKAWYKGEAYNAHLTGVPNAKSIAAMIDGFIGLPDGMASDKRFRYSLWQAGIWAMANTFKPNLTNPSVTSFYYSKGFPDNIVFPADVLKFVEKYKTSQYDALDYLVSHPSFSFFLNAIKNVYPEIYLNIKVSEPKKVSGYADGYQEIADTLDTNKIFYVKECAIDWYGTDVANATIVCEDGQTYDLDDYIALYKKKMDNAKAVLLAAGAAAALI